MQSVMLSDHLYSSIYLSRNFWCYVLSHYLESLCVDIHDKNPSPINAPLLLPTPPPLSLTYKGLAMAHWSERVNSGGAALFGVCPLHISLLGDLLEGKHQEVLPRTPGHLPVLALPVSLNVNSAPPLSKHSPPGTAAAVANLSPGALS